MKNSFPNDEETFSKNISKGEKKSFPQHGFYIIVKEQSLYVIPRQKEHLSVLRFDSNNTLEYVESKHLTICKNFLFEFKIYFQWHFSCNQVQSCNKHNLNLLFSITLFFFFFTLICLSFWVINILTKKVKFQFCYNFYDAEWQKNKVYKIELTQKSERTYLNWYSPTLWRNLL